MLNDKLSLRLTMFMVVGIFVFGILDVLDNFVVLTVLTIVFFAIIIKMILLSFVSEEEHNEQ